ncbi:MAG: NAD(P)-dependent alcohol dehydrogenase [Spirulina sp. SIO3F2]|nr:NAD(P)-dependent alcohol dehydrogenase [Spirulina sp. SIO3F2]
MTTIHAYAAHKPGGLLEPFTYEAGELGPEEVEVNVEYCGICHSDLSMLNNDWEITEYPFVPGHEVIGTVAAIGSKVATVKPGQRVGIGWIGETCGTCQYCRTGDPNLCSSATPVVMRPHGGFANQVRAHQNWVIPIPAALASEGVSPLLCGGATVFNAIVQCGVKSTDHVGVIGLGGLGHMAVAFLAAWGCEVTVFSSSSHKASQAKALGAAHFFDSRDSAALANLADSLDFILSTVNVNLPWNDYLAALSKKGRLHFAGVAPPLNDISVFELLMGQKTLGSSPDANPFTITQMLGFACQHHIQADVEVWPIAQVNAAITKLKTEKPAGRIVLAL